MLYLKLGIITLIHLDYIGNATADSDSELLMCRNPKCHAV